MTLPNAVVMPHVLCNRKAADGLYVLPEDGLYQVAPLGVAPQRNPDTGEAILQVVDQVALDKILANARADGAEWLVDREHQSEMEGGDSESYGWAPTQGTDDLVLRADGLYNRIRWTDLGEAAVKGGRFRYLSPVFEWESVEKLDGGGIPRVRPTRILSLGLTNKPNTLIQSLSNREVTGSRREHTACGGRNNTNNMSDTTTKNNGDGQPSAAASEQGDGGQTILTLRNRVATLEAENKTLRNSVVDGILEQYKEAIPDDDARAGFRELLLANREQGEKTLKALMPDGEEEAPGRLFNKKGAKQPGTTFTEPDAERRASLINRRVAELRERLDFETAHEQAHQELMAGLLR